MVTGRNGGDRRPEGPWIKARGVCTNSQEPGRVPSASAEVLCEGGIVGAVMKCWGRGKRGLLQAGQGSL